MIPHPWRCRDGRSGPIPRDGIRIRAGVIDLFRLNNKLRSKCGDCIQDAAILYAVAGQNHELRQFTKDGGGGSVRPKSNILTYNQSIINPFCLYPQIYPRIDAGFQRSGVNASDELTSML